MTRLLFIFLNVVFLLCTNLAEACPLCFSTGGGNRTAYIATTVVLLLLPLALGVGLGWWIHRLMGKNGVKK